MPDFEQADLQPFLDQVDKDVKNLAEQTGSAEIVQMVTDSMARVEAERAVVADLRQRGKAVGVTVYSIHYTGSYVSVSVEDMATLLSLAEDKAAGMAQSQGLGVSWQGTEPVRHEDPWQYSEDVDGRPQVGLSPISPEPPPVGS